MPHLILRKYKSSEKIELTVPDLKELSIGELKENASSKLGIPQDELKLVFGGRVLKVGKTVLEYKVISGCTIHVMAIKSKKRARDYQSKAGLAGGLMNNPRVLALIGRVLGNPAVLQDMAQGIGMATGGPAMSQILGNQQLLTSLTDPDNIQEYILENPEMAAMMERIIRQFLGTSFEAVADREEEEQLVDLLENHLEEEMAQAEREGQVQREQAQDQMFEHSQALHAHHQQQRQQSHTSTGSSSFQDTSFNPQTSQQHGSVSRLPRHPSRQTGGVSITQDQLASALATALGPSPSSSPQSNTSQIHSNASTDQSSSMPPPSTLQPFHGRPINAASLQQALASVAPPQPQRGGEHSASRYRLQLEQLKLMGIEDETACLHALAATGGNLQAALEILYSQ